MSASSTASSVRRLHPKHQASSAGATADDDDVDGVSKVVASLEAKLHVGSSNGKQSVHEDETPAATAGDSEAELDELCTAVAQLYPQELFLMRAYIQVLDYCQKHSTSWQELQPAFQQHGIDLAGLMADAELQQAALTALDDETGWTLIRDDGLRLLHKHESGSPVHSFKGECTLEAPLAQPLAMARETDLVKQWNEYIEESLLLREVGEADVMVYAAVWMPWPFDSRDMVAQAVGSDMLDEHGCVFITFQSPDDASLPADLLPQEAQARFRLHMKEGSCMRLAPLQPAAPGGPPRTRVSVVGHLDARMPSVPDALIHFVLRVFAPFMYKTVLKVLQRSFADPDGPLRQRMKLRAKLYGGVQQRVDEYLAAGKGGGKC